MTWGEEMRECLRKLGFETVDLGFGEQISEWLQWYKGKVAKFHSYSQYNGKKKVRRESATPVSYTHLPFTWRTIKSSFFRPQR